MSKKFLFQKQQKEFGPLLQLNDKLREKLRDISDINVCTIIVVGDQSHGKTSVIERLTAISLPRGNQIQTRAPTEIRIKSIPENQEPQHTLSYKTKEGEEKDTTFQMDDLADLVRSVQTEMTGNDWDISFEPIYIEIQKKNHKDMTIIDLPGVTRVLHRGQNGDIEKKILELYRRYMQPEQTIIINISNIMVDLDTSASFQLSNKIDPQGQRTIVCFTKIDQFREKGLKQKIEHQIEKFNIDINNVFLIRNRTQQEAEESKNLEFVEEEEINLLNSNIELKDFPDNMKGIQALSRKVVDLQKVKIIVNLNKTHKIIKEQLLRVAKETISIGQNLETIQEIIQTINQNLNTIVQKVNNNYDCINTEQSYFKEIYCTKTNLDEEFTLNEKETGLVCKIQGKTKDINIQFDAKQSCRVSIEIRDMKQKNIAIFEEEVFQNKSKKLMLQRYDKFFMKIILYPNMHGDNLFSKIWKIEDVFTSRINNLYRLEHFLQKNYIQNLNSQIIKLGRGFNSVTNSNQNFLLTILQNQILPSLDDQCHKLLELFYEQIHEDILLKLFQNTFVEYPPLLDELTDITDKFMKNQKKKAQELTHQIILWGKTCYTQNPHFQKIKDELIDYTTKFIKQYVEDENFNTINPDFYPKNQFIDLYKLQREEQKELKSTWEDYNNEVRIVFTLWSYWQINLVRIKESIIPMLRYQFIEYVKGNIFNEIMSQLQDYDEQTLRDLVKPDRKTQLKRQKLEKKKYMLETALKLIEEFCQKNPLYKRKILKKMVDETEEKQ